jgi:hypothetical protein
MNRTLLSLFIIFFLFISICVGAKQGVWCSVSVVYYVVYCIELCCVLFNLNG